MDRKQIQAIYLSACFILNALIMLACGGGGNGGSGNGVIDTQVPSVPSEIILTVVSSDQIDINWTYSSDNVGVSGYRVYRDDIEIIATSSTDYSDTGLTPDTSYCYKILSYDAAGNESAKSPGSCAKTDTVPSSWSITALDTQGDVGLSTSIATGSVHISYYDSTNNNLKYINYSSGVWNTPVTLASVGSISLATTFSALSLDSAGNIYIGYYDATTITNGDLKLTSCKSSNDCNQSSNWSSVTIDSAGDVGSDTSMVIDPSDNIHVSYYDSVNGFLKYASCMHGNDCNQESNWTTLAVDTLGNVGQFSSITVDSLSNIHISYYDSIGFFEGNLKYAFCSASNDCTSHSNWDIVKIDDSADVGQYSSIAVDSLNNIHISYYDFNSGNLKYAFCPSSSDCTEVLNWSTVTIDRSSDVGDYSSIAVDPQDNLHISYHDFKNERLKYATCPSSVDCLRKNNWAIYVVDGTAKTGDFSSIAADENGNIHVSYYDSENKDLKYAVKTIN